MKQILVLVSIFFACYFFCQVQSREDRLHDCPQLMLWAWERPENLRWINSNKVGVAFLARTLTLNEETVSIHTRRQPLDVPPGTYMMAVVRLESNTLHLPKFSDSQVDAIVKAILAVGGGHTVKAIQIDFDARESERIAYRQILERLRSSLPENVGLSMTALASWCAGDYWLAKLPVDEIVPLYFRMGTIGNNRQEYLDYKHHLRCLCDKSIGIATDEFVDRKYASNRRVYIFSPHAWVREQVISSADYLRFTRFK
jgi:hypothetical protein